MTDARHLATLYRYVERAAWPGSPSGCSGYTRVLVGALRILGVVVSLVALFAVPLAVSDPLVLAGWSGVVFALVLVGLPYVGIRVAGTALAAAARFR